MFTSVCSSTTLIRSCTCPPPTEKELDKALADSFPASDPISLHGDTPVEPADGKAADVSKPERGAKDDAAPVARPLGTGLRFPFRGLSLI
jgi:hypothetical protein